MIIREKLFSKGMWTRQPSLSDVLEGHRQRTIHSIKSINNLDQLNEGFLTGIVKVSLVEPLAFNFAAMTFATRTEQIPGDWFPQFEFDVMRGRCYPKTVARISIPFTGNRDLLEYTPNQSTMNYPIGARPARINSEVG